MAWDINIGIKFEERLAPTLRGLQLLDFLSTNSHFATIARFSILKNTGDGRKTYLVDLRQIGEKGVLYSECFQQMRQYHDEDIAVRVDWDTIQRGITIEGVDYRDDLDRKLTKRKYDLMYYGGLSTEYSPTTIHSYLWERNLSALVEELGAFIGLGVSAMLGMDPDFSDDPIGSYVCYYRNLDRYRQDLIDVAAASTKFREVLREDIVQASLNLPSIGSSNFGTELIVYSKDFLYLSLNDFYDFLYDILAL